MNKKAQGDIVAQVFAAIVGIMILIAFVPIMTSLFTQTCPTCDCSPYQNQLTQCQQQVANLTGELNNRSIIYINNTIEVPVEKVVEKIVYGEGPVSITIISLSLIVSLALSIFSFTIKLPKELEQKLERIELGIIGFRIGSLVLTILIFIKLLIILL